MSTYRLNNADQRAGRLVDPRDWNGLDLTGTNDVTSILQAAIDQSEVDQTGVQFPKGLMTISAPLVSHQYEGVVYRGMGYGGGSPIGGTFIRQAGNNMPVLSIGTKHSFVIENMALGYVTPQDAAHPLSIALQSHAHAGAGLYNGTFRNLTISNAYTGIGVEDQAGQRYSIWGSLFERISFASCFMHWVNINPNTSGVPNNSFRNIYGGGQRLDPAAVLFQFVAGHGIFMSNIEINGAPNGFQVVRDVSGGGPYIIESFDCEQAVFAGAGNKILFEFRSTMSSVQIGSITLDDITVDARQIRIIETDAAVQDVSIGSLKSSAMTVSNGGVVYVASGSDENGPPIRIGHISDYLLAQSWFDISNLASSAAANRVVFDSKGKGRTIVNADADKTLTMQSHEFQHFPTLSANRTVTLPSAANTSVKYMSSGAGFVISKPPGTTGDLIITAAAGTLPNRTIPAAKGGFAEYRYYRQSNGWILVRFYTEP